MTAEKILIVEDSRPIVNLLKKNLEIFGYRIPACVASGEQAVEAAGKHMPDVILMDIELEGKIDGIEAARQIRQEFDIPAIFITGDSGDSTLERSHLADPIGYILKPFTQKTLRTAVETGLYNYYATREKTKKSLQAVEVRYRNLVENLDQGVFHINDSGKFILVNTYLAKMMGYENCDELLRLVPRAKKFFVSMEDYKELLQILESDGCARDFEFQACCRDGSKIWLSQNARVLRDPESGKSFFEGFVRDITKRKKLEEEWLYLMARQTAMLAAIPDIIMEVDSNKTYTWANKFGFEFFGGDVIGRQASEYFEGEQDTYESVQSIFNGALDSIYIESWQRRKDGQKRLLAWQCQQLKDNAGKVVGALSSARDITDSKLAEEERSRSLERQVRLNRMQQELLGGGDLARKLKIISDGIVDIFKVDFCRIWLIGPGDLCGTGCRHAAVEEGLDACRNRDKCLQLISSSGRYTDINSATHQRIPFDAYKIGRIASGKEHLLTTNDVANDPAIRDHDWVKRLDLVSFAGFQLHLDENRPIGVLALFSKHAITPEEQIQLEALSHAAAQIIHSSQVDEDLKKSEERFRLITEHIDEVFWISDLENNPTYISSAFERVWGFTREDLYKSVEFFRRAIHPEDRERVVSAFAQQKDGSVIDQEYRIIRSDGSTRIIWDRGFPIPDETGRITHYVGVAQDITSRKNAEEELKKSKEYMNRIINSIGDPIFVKDDLDRNILANDAMCAFTGKERADILGKTTHQIMPKRQADLILKQEKSIWERGLASISDEEVTDKQGNVRTLMTNKSVLVDEDGNKQIIGVIRDITEMKKAERDRANMEIQLRQAQKLEAIGQLAAGIAHEINTPTQYINDNTRFLKDAFADFLKALEGYNQLLLACREGKVDSTLVEKVESVIAASDLDFLLEETPKAISQSLEGLDRISTIVRAMKEFSHPGCAEKQNVDLNHSIENTLMVCRNEWKYVAEVVTDFEKTLPLVPCLPGEINQVILNLVINGAHAISDAAGNGGNEKGLISVSTRHDGNWAEIRIGDTGTGISEENRSKIFTPFFTTKEVGKGTGQGLAISRSVVVDKHNGTIDFETEPGKGTIFIVRLPLGSGMIQ
jgi:PAS domain S-box-containing protein